MVEECTEQQLIDSKIADTGYIVLVDVIFNRILLIINLL